MPEPQVRGRFAPSPTGPLHLGSLTAALGSWLMARQAGGEWLVRIEDLDPPREVPGAAQRQLQALAGFGLLPDGPVLFQSARGDQYAAALATLAANGEAFECRCTRSDLAATGGIHRACVARPSGRRAAWRLRAPAGPITFHDRIRGAQAQDLRAEVGDFVLRRSDGYWAYQLAVVVDDALQGITEVVRGADLLESTPRQLLLQRRLGLPQPGYAHLPLLLDERGRKLSKSLRSLPVDGADPLPALRLAWSALGQDPAVLAGAGPVPALLARALAAFEVSRIPAVDLPLAQS
jgi:glutamyl-Q tRNA(Asp) synthetase